VASILGVYRISVAMINAWHDDDPHIISQAEVNLKLLPILTIQGRALFDKFFWFDSC
jgi:hypothetical protein